MNNFKIFTLATTISICSCCNLRQQKLEFIIFDKNEQYVPESDSIKKTIDYMIIIKNYRNNKKSENLIDSFAFKLANGKVNNYASFIIDFYKASNYTNVKNLKDNPRDLDRRSNTEDHIYNYYWSQGTFLNRYKYKNGKTMQPSSSSVKLSDPPPLKK